MDICADKDVDICADEIRLICDVGCGRGGDMSYV